MINHFKQKTVLITGASRGLGEQIARHFYAAGAHLILLARHEENLINLRKQLINSKRSEQTIEVLPLDLAQPHLVEKAVFPAIDILVNNAAIQGPVGPIWENDWQKWQETLQVNLLAPVALCRKLAPMMCTQKFGKIINLSGGGATTARPQFSAYAAAKAGLVRFSETLAEELKSFAIDVNCIAPGVMNTQLLATGPILENDNLQRAAELCLFLASEQSNGITGKIISAVWDPWQNLAEFLDEIKNSDIYTLRRIVPKDRGKVWGDV